jgi:hypothetical protein
MMEPKVSPIELDWRFGALGKWKANREIGLKSSIGRSSGLTDLGFLAPT